eukprot:c4257_g1_i1.p1 GENE.c4257_g1_i1~~c4257_g1_i1.p1  ORF type:complete len:142 (+),score=22.12 c4257_g1_i1:35-460(+)
MSDKQTRRLFVGNLARNVTESQIIRLFKQFGTVKSESFAWHKSGPHQGLPKGFCFVELATPQEAEKAMNALNGFVLFGRPLCVSLAHAKTYIAGDKKPHTTHAPTQKQEDPERDLARCSAGIHAIEAKLKMMEEEKKAQTK